MRGYHIKQKKGMSHWGPLLEEWLLAIERFCRVTKGNDAPYWYNERANLGTLAAAAWRCGRIALEEFQYQKGYKNKPKWLGRADLWIASDDHEELIEAKFSWCSLKSKNGVAVKAAEVLDTALPDAKKTRGGDEALKAIGVAFVSFYAKKHEVNNIDQLIKDAIKDLHKVNYHALAWCFPSETRNSESNNGNIIPGVAVLAINVDLI
jgi:hypothetical protein